jgi:uncharacterized DUF497 family protein
MADFEWDPAKEFFNIQKHGIDFSTAKLICDGSVFERVDRRRAYGEVRIQAFGVADPDCHLYLAGCSSPNYLGQKGELQ